MASTIKVTNINTPDGTGNITVDRPLSGSGASLTSLPAANLTGSIAAIDGNALVGISPRNYFIDGGHTQWPQGTGATAFADAYQAGGHPLFVHYNITGTGTLTTERSTDVPTIAASRYQSQYSQLIKCTGTDAVPATSTQVSMRYHMTGTDFAHLHQQEITISLWAKTSAQNAGHKYFWTLINSGNNRTYSHSFSPTATWTKFSHTLTLDTSGTWLFTEADVGMKFQINLAIGPDYDDATENTWTGSFELHDGTISNFTDHTSNEFYFTQIQIVKGSSSPDFTSPPISTVREQVDYYVQLYEYANEANEMICSGFQNSTPVSHCQLNYRNYLRTAAPTITHAAAAGFAVSVSGGISSATSFTDNNKGRHGCRFSVTHGSQGAAKDPCSWARDGSDTCWILIDSRH